MATEGLQDVGDTEGLNANDGDENDSNVNGIMNNKPYCIFIVSHNTCC